MVLRRGAAFWLMGGQLATLMAAAGAPSPLYHVYQAAWRFSPTTLTEVFAVYAVALLAAFLVAGRLSDHLGRRPVIVVGLLVEIGATVLFVLADSAGWLYAARTLQGVGTGVATGAASAALVDLAPAGDVRLAQLVNSAAPAGGLAVGALGSSVLVQYGPDPMRLLYWLLLAMFVLELAGTLFMAEPGRRTPGAWASLRPSAGVPRPARRAFAAGVPCLLAGWALGGFYLALGPSLATSLLHTTNLTAGGLVIFLLTGVGAIAVIVGRRLAGEAAMGIGCALLAVGVAGTVAAIAARSGAGLIVATTVAGVGFGLSFLGVFRVLTALAPPTGRAALITSIYVVSYLAISLPVIAAGVAVTHAGLRSTSIWYGSAVAVLAAVIAIVMAPRTFGARSTGGATSAAAAVPPGPCCAPAHPTVRPLTPEPGLAVARPDGMASA